ncbi:MAG TPA: hypothetical protein VGB82_08995 [Alphaproteobacteria bacterium]
MIPSIRSILWLLALVWLLGVGPARAAENFVPGVDDLPLMPGLSALTGQGVVFEAPSGRVIEAWAEGAVSRDAVLSFYGSTLPQLGWTAAAPDLFRREGETLRLEFPAAGNRTAQPAAAGLLLIRFYLSPG